MNGAFFIFTGWDNSDIMVLLTVTYAGMYGSIILGILGLGIRTIQMFFNISLQKLSMEEILWNSISNGIKNFSMK